MVSNNIISIEVKTPPQVAKEIAERVKLRRLELNLTQAGLAKKSGVKLGTYRKFETSGMISLIGLLRIAFALDSLDDFNSLFSRKEYSNIQEVIDDARLSRKRGKRND